MAGQWVNVKSERMLQEMVRTELEVLFQHFSENRRETVKNLSWL